MIHVVEHDIGWSYEVADKAKVVMITRIGTAGCPPPKLLREEDRFFLRNDKNYEHQLLSKVDQMIEDNVVIILPEFATSLSIEKRIREKLDSSGKRCIVVAGSYYQQDRENERLVHSLCPILIPNRATIYQCKFAPCLFEQQKQIAFAPNDEALHIFSNTGFGDFAVLICSDALGENIHDKEAILKGRIDMLVVIARNKHRKSRDLAELSRRTRWIVAYCNGIGGGSSVFSPYKENKVDKSDCVQLNVPELESAIAGYLR